MNPLTLVKRIQKINSQEAALGISESASWHAKYKESAYVFVGGIPFDLTEGDLLAVFSQYGEIVDVNLVRDKGTGKSKGFAFVAYEDQRSTNLAVDNLNGAQILGRIIRVDHVSNYKKKEEEDEETERQKREARGVCRAFQRGECNRGAGCKFRMMSKLRGWEFSDHGIENDPVYCQTRVEGMGVSDHVMEIDPVSCQKVSDAEMWIVNTFCELVLYLVLALDYTSFQLDLKNGVLKPTLCWFLLEQDNLRASNTGWGSEDKSSRWGHDKFQGSTKSDGRPNSIPTNRVHEPTVGEGHRFGNKDARSSRTKGSEGGRESHHRRSELDIRDQDGRGLERQMEQKEKELNYKEDQDRRTTERRSGRPDSNPGEDHDRRGEDQDIRATERRSRRHDSNPSEDHDRRGEDQDIRATERRSRRHDFESNPREDDRKEEDRDRRATERRSRRSEFESNPREDHDRREEKRSRRHELESKLKKDHDRREEKQSRRHERQAWRANARGNRLQGIMTLCAETPGM
ncbi:Zinc finger CCCH domain-containing protein 42 [Vitis vinifera]|uniref:Zinc finger CCCH domain-containing protein 42 n=1 Tax=Vitis vinifera TaxID=29760 RepID=A0A438F9T9_VITVI|nr:Zinc finger CCCH domain-containing protein 42 [Vitis vinifera]